MDNKRPDSIFYGAVQDLKHDFYVKKAQKQEKSRKTCSEAQKQEKHDESGPCYKTTRRKTQVHWSNCNEYTCSKWKITKKKNWRERDV